MDRAEEGSKGTEAETRNRRSSLRFVGAGLASVLALGVPLDGGSQAGALGPVRLVPYGVPGFSTLPAGWPGPVPDLKTPLEADVWSQVRAACSRHGILDEAVTMYMVLWEESRLSPKALSTCGRYRGIGQFRLSTFEASVRSMQKLGLIWGDAAWSPFDPAQAIEVMAWMWSRGCHEQWGPYRRVVRQPEAVQERIAAEAVTFASLRARAGRVGRPASPPN